MTALPRRGRHRPSARSPVAGACHTAACGASSAQRQSTGPAVRRARLNAHTHSTARATAVTPFPGHSQLHHLSRHDPAPDTCQRATGVQGRRPPADALPVILHRHGLVGAGLVEQRLRRAEAPEAEAPGKAHAGRSRRTIRNRACASTSRRESRSQWRRDGGRNGRMTPLFPSPPLLAPPCWSTDRIPNKWKINSKK